MKKESNIDWSCGQRMTSNSKRIKGVPASKSPLSQVKIHTRSLAVCSDPPLTGLRNKTKTENREYQCVHARERRGEMGREKMRGCRLKEDSEFGGGIDG